MSGSETEGYFKPDDYMAPAKYGVGASRLAQGIGWGSLIPETQFAAHGVMDEGALTTKKGAVSKAVKNSVPLATNIKGQGDEVDDANLRGANTQRQLNQLQ